MCLLYIYRERETYMYILCMHVYNHNTNNDNNNHKLILDGPEVSETSEPRSARSRHHDAIFGGRRAVSIL